MTPAPPRSAEQRRSDALAKLEQKNVDVWVATAAADGDAHLVPLSLAWDGDRVILATERRSITCANLERSRRARLAVGPERDVVMIDGVVVSFIDATRVPHPIAEAFVAQADWDPREDPDDYVYIVFVPERIQAWREANEIKGRTLMRHGQWLV